MSKELRDAAERLRRLDRGDKLTDIYLSLPRAIGISILNLVDGDRVIVADGYLAEHPEDEEQKLGGT